MGLLFSSAGAHTYLKSGQVAPPPPPPRNGCAVIFQNDSGCRMKAFRHFLMKAKRYMYFQQTASLRNHFHSGI